jgi:hypothetical protein
VSAGIKIFEETAEAPAVKARRIRRLKYFGVIPYCLLFLGVGIVVDANGYFAFKSVQIAFAAIFALAIIALGLWRMRIPCPRCGWNIYLRKDSSILLLATRVPSICPSCGLDLEKPYTGVATPP